MHSRKPGVTCAAVVAISVTLLLTATSVTAQEETVLYNFASNNTDGTYPDAGLVSDSAGNLYGTTYSGGTHGVGAVFELTPKLGGGWNEKVLHNFNTNGTDGSYPQAGLIVDASGDLYGTTYSGGVHGFGTVFELTPPAGGGWGEKILHAFNSNSTDGQSPSASLIFDAAGNLYGTTVFGGTADGGTAFELSPTKGGSWGEKILHNFTYSATDGNEPFAGLIFDSAGNLYGTTAFGGAHGGGMVFELVPNANGSWGERILTAFADNGTEGYNPFAGLIADASGNLYGVTYRGGTDNKGTVFELTPHAGGGWLETTPHNFLNDGTDGNGPYPALIFDTRGNLYGTTTLGGTNGAGTAFELAPQGGGVWNESILYDFNDNGTDGFAPVASLIFDSSGNLYGTTYLGGASDSGAVFEITP
jgi:uncharacterized repeat protein (TIGR03803 family)